MGRPRDSRTRDAVFEVCDRLMQGQGKVRIADVRAAAGIKYSYASMLVKEWHDLKRGTVRECLCCDDSFVSSGKHHRLCDRCRVNGEYMAPYPISPSIMHVGRTF